MRVIEWVADKGIPYAMGAGCWSLMVSVWLSPGIHWVMYPFMLLTFGLLGAQFIWSAITDGRLSLK